MTPPKNIPSLFFFAALFIAAKKVEAGCYFPLELQGEFLTQSTTSREIGYYSISILFDSIPTWGLCHRRLGHHVILRKPTAAEAAAPDPPSEADLADEEQCYKCLLMESRSQNVLQLYTNGLEKCYSTEEEARESCPSQQQIDARKAQEIMLYKTRDFYGGSAITKTYCPINGDYKFTYSINDGTEDDLECREPLSEASDCPTGYKFDLRFRGCSFRPDFDMSFQCLASWPGKQGETYMSLLDTKLPQLGEEPRPRYRCALFKEDPSTGLTHVALSSDSTCVNHLYSSQDGYETLHLARQEKKKQRRSHEDNQHPEHPRCIFPDWMQGQWEGVNVQGGEMSYRDETNFVTYRGKCVRSTEHSDRFVVSLDTDCGQPAHYCALFQQRDVNVMEFQLGSQSGDSGDVSLCNAENFSPSKWLTLGRTDIEEPPHCPLVGEYTGVLPDAEGLCAKSYADCNNPEVMFYTVFNCQNRSEVYEEREYRCYGQWEEDGLVYTYTQRRDLPGNECFVGVTIDENENIVTEAGQNCERGHQPSKYGMTLHRQSTCSHERPRDHPSQTPQQNYPSFEAETDRPVSPKFGVISTRGPNRHGGQRTRRPHPENDDDLFSNEIPGSASPSSFSPSSAPKSHHSSTTAMSLIAAVLLLKVFL